ncbi:hypothetical protein HMPREF1982_02270 [Clostridiales bacterium oral taxon 876 str. F0540]|nr:hypothetical protein HMPREF1982_02270 [Clostridiales bacterium oral taxon 876 str. F0540]
MDYLDWRGDLSMTVSQFNEVDNLILAQLSYVDFENIVPGIDSNKSISVKEASDLFFQIYEESKIMLEESVAKVSVCLMKKMAQCERFSKLRLSKYVNKIQYEEQKQFSAINIELNDETIYVAFRGTDDTLVGWKEDFNMSFMTTIPAQLEAVDYLTETTIGRKNKIRIGGHSKGGNLAVYAAVKCCSEIKENIIEVYNNDGPGFSREMINSIEYREIRNRIKTIVPQTSIVGMMLEHEEEYIVVSSKQKHIMQHYAMSWEVLGKQFVYVSGITEGSRRIDAILKAWLNNMDTDERERFVDSLFYIFEAADIKSPKDISKDKWAKIAAMRKVISSMPIENRQVLFKTIRFLLGEGSRVFRYRNKQNESGIDSKTDLSKMLK